MFTNLKRILMAEADAPTGSIIAPVVAPTSQESVPQAQGAPVITKEIAELIGSTVAKAVAEQRDSIFAEARRTFTEKKSAKQPLPAPDSAAAPEALSIEDRFSLVRDLDRALLSSGLSTKLNAAQMKRAEKALLAERPDDVAQWAKDYFEGYGAAPSPAPAATPAPIVAATPQRPQNEHPVSDRGAPPAAKVALEDQNIFTLSEADQQALLKAKGAVWLRNKMLSDGKSIKFGGRSA